MTAFTETCTLKTTRLTLCVDSDDPMRHEYTAICRNNLRDPVSLKIAERQRMGPTLNAYATAWSADNPGDIVGFMGDDHLPITVGWDEEIRRDLEAVKAAIWYGNDLIQGPNIPTAVAMTTNIVNAIGYMVAPGLTHLYIDNFWKQLGSLSMRLIYRNDVIIQHMHPIAGTGAWDAGYEEVNSGQMYEADEKAWQEYSSTRLFGDVMKIRQLVKHA